MTLDGILAVIAIVLNGIVIGFLWRYYHYRRWRASFIAHVRPVIAPLTHWTARGVRFPFEHTEIVIDARLTDTEKIDLLTLALNSFGKPAPDESPDRTERPSSKPRSARHTTHIR